MEIHQLGAALIHVTDGQTWQR